MKAKNFIIAILLAGLFCLSFSGCSFFDLLSMDSLLRPPKLTGENAALQEAFERETGGDIILFSPLAGKFRSAYILFDYNNDKTDEAIVFYSQNDNKNVVHMHLMAQSNDKWFSVADIVGSGADVYKVDFFDLDNNNDMEIAVTWLQDTSKRNKTLSLYKLADIVVKSNSAINSLATIQLADYIYLDIDYDGVNELLYFYFDSSDKKTSVCARLLEFNADDLTLLPVSDIKLDSQIASIAQISFDKYAGEYRIYLDCLLSDSNYCTEMLLFDKKKSVLLIPSIEGCSISALTVRKNALMCSDFNNDSYIDIPSTLPFDEFCNKGTPEELIEKIMLVEWFMYGEGVLISIGKYFINGIDGYSISIDDFYDYSYIEYDYINRAALFRLKNAESGDNIIFSVICKNKPKILDKSVNEYLIVVTTKGQTLNISRKHIRELIREYR